MPVLRTGIYDGLSDAVYHADPCPEPSLNQSAAKVLLTRSPRHAWAQHPRLNPAYEPATADRFDIGSLVHRLLLGRGRDIHRVDAADWRTKEARAAKGRAHGAGAIPCLERHYQAALILCAAAREQIRDCGIDFKPETTPGVLTEAAFIWEDAGTWLRTKIDRVQDNLSIDIKTIDGSGDPGATARRMIDMGWHIQAGFYERAFTALCPERVGKTRYLNIQIEIEEPFAVGVWEMAESALHMARTDIAMALAMWRTCLAQGFWPSYNVNMVQLLQAPSWARTQWELRHGLTGEPMQEAAE